MFWISPSVMWLFKAVVWIQSPDHFTLWSSGQCYQTRCLTSWPRWFTHAQLLLSFSSHRFTSFLPVPPSPLHNVVMCQRKRSVFLWKAFEALECRMPLRGAQYPVWGSVDCCLLPPLPCPQCPPLFYCAKSWTLSGPPEDCSQVGALLASWNTINKNPNYQRQGFDITQMRLRTYWLYTLSPEAHDISTSFCQ